jgi:hypothetical protein
MDRRRMKTLTYEQWVNQFLKNAARHLNLAGWTINTEFSDEEKGASYAEASVNSSYQFITVHVYAPAKRDFESGKTKVLVMALLHELVHTFIDPFHDFAEPHLSEVTQPLFMNIVEQQTQKLTMVLLKTLPESIIPKR